MIDPFTGASAVARFFLSVGKFIGQAAAFLAKPAVQIGLMVAQGVMSHQAAMKAKRTGADILLQKYGTGGGIPVIYGTRRVAGTVVYMETQNNRELYVVYAIAAHEIDSFDLESIQLDGRTIKDTNIYRQGYDISDGTTRINFRPSSVTRASGTFWGNTSAERTNITDPANTGDNARMTFNCHKGTTTQAADPMLEGILTNWTSSHKLTGIAYIAANYEYDTQGMFTGIPNLTVVVNGKKVFDPRDTGQTFGTESTYTHSSNAALCLLDYITNDDYGKGLGTSDLESDFASWKTAADDCDTSVDTIDHTGISVESASTDSDVMIIADASQAKFNKLKVGNKYTVDDGTTTYVNNKKLIDKDSTQIDLDGSNPFAILKLKFEDGAIDNAITSATSCDFAETQIRFDCNGVLDTEETVLENTKLLIANMRGIFTYANGKYEIKVEGTESSVVTLNEDDILESGITLSLENKEAKYNKVEAEFYNAQKRYESDTTYYTGETSDTFLADDGNEVLETRIQLPFCTNQRIAYNHAKGLLKRSRKQKTISFVATPKVLKAKVGEVITVSNTNLNLSSELYRITNMTINPDLNIAVTAIEYQTDVYGYVTPPDEDIDIPDDPPEGNRVVAPTNLTFTNKDATTGEAAKLTWTDSTKYPSYEFRVRIIDGLKTRYDKRVKDTYFYLDGISVKNGYEARVSAINALGVESDSTNITVNVTTEPITTPDIKQGSIGGFSFTDSKMYHPVDGSDTGVFETSNVYIDDAGQFSLKDKLSWNGTTLDISGNLTVENTITADKITLDGTDLSTLLAYPTEAAGDVFEIDAPRIRFNINGFPQQIISSGSHDYQGAPTIAGIGRMGIGTNISSGHILVVGGVNMITVGRNLVNLGTISNSQFTIPNTAGSAGQVLKWPSSGTTLEWGAATGGTTTTINNNADNRIITGSNTADTLNGESNLTFDGSTLNVTGRLNTDTAFIGTSNTANISHGALVINHGTLPQILFDGGGDTNLDIAVPNGEVLQIGHWNTSTSSASLRLSMETNGTFSFEGNPIQGVGGLTVNGDISLPNGASTIDFGGSGQGGPHGLNFADDDGTTVFRALYRTSPNTLTFENAGESAKHTFDLSGNYTAVGTISSGAITASAGSSGATLPSNRVITLEDNANAVMAIAVPTTSEGGLFFPRGTVAYYAGIARNNTNLLLKNNNATVLTLDSSLNATFAGTISSGNIFANNGEFTGSFLYTSGDLRIGTATGATNQTGIIKHNGTTYGLGLFNWADANPIFIGGSEVNFRTESGSAIALKSNGTTFLDASRNLTNIGTISSGTITTSGSVNINTVNDGLYFSGGNNRIYFTNYRALEGNTSGSLLQIGEGYSNTRLYGNVGVGTNSPDGLLHVSAGNSGDAIVIIQADEDNNAEGDVPQLWFKADGDITEGAVKLDDNELQLVSNVSSSGGITFWTGTTNNTGTTAPQTGATQKFKITSGGDFQVGTTTVIDGSRNLTNIGTISCGAITTSASPTITGNAKSVKFTGTSGPFGLEFGDTEANPNFRVYYRTNPNTLTFENSSSSAKHTFDLSGNYVATGNITAYSDERLKDNIKTLDGSKVFAMRGVSFNKDNKAGSGVIAQEIEKIAPELVHTADDDMGTKSVAYGNLVGYLIEAIKELKAEIEELKKA